VLDVEVSTRQGYVRKIDKHIRPVLGGLQVGRLDAETLESLYAVLRRCRARCGGRKYIDHRTTRKHECDGRCRPHICKPLSASSIRQIHWILSGALNRAVRWKWISINPADQAEKPGLPHPDPVPPSAKEAARIVTAAWDADPDWGMFVWLAMVTGARRAELCALRWSHVDLDGAVLSLRRALYVDGDGVIQEKDTKAHQQRRVALDAEMVEMLRQHRSRCEERAAALGVRLGADARLFSYAPDGSACWLPGRTAACRLAVHRPGWLHRRCRAPQCGGGEPIGFGSLFFAGRGRGHSPGGRRVSGPGDRHDAVGTPVPVCGGERNPATGTHLISRDTTDGSRPGIAAITRFGVFSAAPRDIPPRSSTYSAMLRTRNPRLAEMTWSSHSIH
jgi:integrase